MSTISKSQQIRFENLVTQTQQKFPGKPRLWVIYRLTDKGITPETM
jgi:galactose mutarotase-like enzyme